jgi:tetratricopeptide (TPR) repeat protein
MRPTRFSTAALLLTASIAVACSKRDDTSKMQPAPDLAAVKPIATSGESVPPPAVESAATTPLTQPITFADGKAAYDARKYHDATAIFERYTGRNPKNAWGQYMLGMSSWKGGDLSKAEGAFESALTIDPRHIKSYINLGRVLIEQKRYDDAVSKLTRAAELEPSSSDAQRLLGRAYSAQGKSEEAMTAYQQAIEINELDAWSMNNLGLLLLEQKRADEALPLFEKAAELKKEVAAFHNNRGMALEHVGRFKDAATAYSDALNADPGYDKAKQNLTRVDAIK